MTVRRYLTERLRDPGCVKAQCSVLLPPRCGRWRRRRRGLGGPRPVVLRQRVHCGVNAAPVIGVVVAIGGRQGGGEAHGVPGRGEEDKYQGRKVQCGVDEAQRRREEEEGGSVGGWAAGPGGGGRARVRQATAMAGDWTATRRMPTRRVSERGVSPC